MAIVCQQTTNSNTPSIASSTTALASNPARTGWNIQNLGQNVLYVLMGAGASSTVFHVALKAATSNDDGTGGTVGQEQGVVYTGIITIAGTSPRYTMVEFAA